MQRDDLVATVAGFAVAAAVFAVMFWLVDANAVFEAAAGANPLYIAGVAGAILLWNASLGLALWNVLRALDIDVPLRSALLVNAAGAFANHVTPLGQAGGEPVTAWLLTRTAGTDYEVSLASIASLDAINFVPSIVFASAGSVYYVTATSGRGELGWLPAGVLAAAVALPLVATLAWRNRRTVRRQFGRFVAPTVRRVVDALPVVSLPSPEWFAERASGFADAVRRVAVSRKRLAAAIGCSALGSAFQAVALWVTFLALDSFVPIYVPFFVLPLGRAGSLFPTPGGLGGTEAINVTLLSLLTAASAPTVAAAVTIHSLGGYLLTTTVGAAATGVLGVRS